MAGMMRSLVAFCLLSAVNAYDVYAYYPNSINSLYLRGDSCGLNWDDGVKMTQVEGSNVAWMLSIECAANEVDIEIKVLVADKTWMLGANHHADTGNSTSTTGPII